MRTPWIVLLAAGCATHLTLTNDPTQHAPTASPPLALFSVDWRVKLVTPSVAIGNLEYLPREPASPAIDPDTHRLIALTRDGAITSVDPDGRVEWSFHTLGNFSASATVRDGTVYAPGGDGTLYALAARTGELQWKYSPGEELATQPVLAAGKVLVASHSNTLYAVEQKTGRWLWQYRRDLPSGFSIRGASTPVVKEGVAYVGFADGAVVALKVDDGSVKWERSLSSGSQFVDVDSTPVLDEQGRLFVAAFKDGVFALEAASGKTLWRSDTPGVTSLIERSGVLFAGGDEELMAMLADGGKVLWRLPLPARVAKKPLFSRGLLLVPTANALLFVDAASGTARVGWNPGKGVSATPLSAGSHLYVLSNLGYLYALKLHGRAG